MEDRAIASLATSCMGLFEQDIAEADQPDDIFEETTAFGVDEFLDNQAGRFRIWAANIGVFAAGHASLDYRLRDSPSVKTLMLDQLHSLQKFLRNIPIVETDENPEEPDDDDSGSDVSDGAESLPSLSSESDNGEATMPRGSYELQMIPETITRLHRLTVAIRKPALVSQNSKAAKYQEFDEYGRDIFEIFENNVALFLVKFHFPDAQEFLHRRLSKTMTFRRRRFQYRKRHQIKLSGPKYVAPKRKYLSAGPVSHSHASQPLNFVLSNEIDNAAREKTVDRPRSELSATTASKFEETKFRPDGPSTRASSIISGTGSQRHKLDIPPAPRIPEGASEFFCPHCSLVLPATEAKDRRWRQHLMRDLEPYVCLAEGCPDSDHLFRDRGTWYAHMRTHSREWCCGIAGHAPIVFNNESEYEAHMESAHQGSFTKTQMETIKLRSVRPSTSPFHSCPLCPYDPSQAPELRRSSLQISHDPALEQSKIALALQEHIVSHLHFLAIYCLAAQDEMDGSISSDEPSLRRANSSTIDASDVSSLAESVGGDDVNSIPFVSPSDEYDDFLRDHIAPASTDSIVVEDWSFVYNDQKPYPTHELDPVLSNFIRRVKMEALLADGKAADPVLPCHYIPLDRSRNFYGREEVLHKLEVALTPQTRTAAALSTSRHNISTVVLQGDGGVGKTQIAAEFAYKMADSFDAIFWVHADEPSKLAKDINRIAIKLGLVSEKSAESRDQSLTRDLVKTWLMNPLKNFEKPEESPKATWLLIFDHVMVPDIVNDYWPIGGSTGSILITSRKPMGWSVHKYPALSLAPFSAEEAAGFLSKLTHRKTSEEQEQGRVIGSRVNGFPHELTLLARIIVRGGFSFSGFLEEYDQKQSQRAVLKLNVQDLSAQRDDFFSGWALEILEESSSALLEVLSMLDPDGVPERILTAEPSFVYIDHYPNSKTAYDDARSELLDYGLVTRDRTSGNLLLHRLIQDAARRRMTKDHSRAVFNTCVKLLNAVWPYQPFTWRHSIKRWHKCEELFPHIIRLQKFAKHIDTAITDLNGAYEYARLTTDAGWYCHERGRSLESEEFCDIAENICNSLMKFYPLNYNIETDESPTEKDINNILAEIYHNRGCIAAEMNRPYEALTNHTKFNDMMVKEIGDGPPGNDMRLAISWSQLGAAYMINDDWGKGDDCFRKAINMMRRVDDYEPFKISLPLVNLGLSWWLSGRYEDAVITLHEGIRHREQAFGRNDRESFITGRFYHALGNVKASQGLLDESLEYHQKAHDHYKVTLGKGHHRTADTCIKLAEHQLRRGQAEMAIDLFEQALKVYGEQEMYYPEKARALYMRCKAFQLMGRPEEASCDSRESLRLYRHAKPEDDRPFEELGDSDFDQIIVFWSR